MWIIRVCVWVICTPVAEKKRKNTMLARHCVSNRAKPFDYPDRRNQVSKWVGPICVIGLISLAGWGWRRVACHWYLLPFGTVLPSPCHGCDDHHHCHHRLYPSVCSIDEHRLRLSTCLALRGTWVILCLIVNDYDHQNGHLTSILDTEERKREEYPFLFLSLHVILFISPSPAMS